MSDKPKENGNADLEIGGAPAIGCGCFIALAGLALFSGPIINIINAIKK